MSGTLPSLTCVFMARNGTILYTALVVILREKNDWKTRDEMGGWFGSRRRNNRGKILEEPSY